MDGVLYSWIKDIFATDPFNSSAVFSMGTGTFVCFSKRVVCQLHLLWKYSKHRFKKIHGQSSQKIIKQSSRKQKFS